MKLEYKYLVKKEQLGILRKRLLPFLEIDPFVQDENNIQYTVRSIYYDTSGYDYYHEKIDGIKIRKKLRIRSYDNLTGNSVVFLEIKNKYENYIGKNRSPIMYHDLKKLIETKSFEAYSLTHNGFANSIEDGERFFHFAYKDGLRPTILIVYEREAFFSKFDKRLRITFDKNLRYLEKPDLHSLYKDNDLSYVIPNHFILEIKFENGYPRWLQDIIIELNLVRRSVSKYTICIDSSKTMNPFKKNLISPNFYSSYDSITEEGIF